MIRFVSVLATLAFASLCLPIYAQSQEEAKTSKVYFTKEITPESLVKIYQALAKEATGKVAVKISTGESAQSSDPRYVFQQPHGQDAFLESMAGAAQSVHNYFKGKKGIVYINVMNNLSVDCDCDGHPAAPQMKDIGILASLDPVALDKACLDLVFNHESTAGDNSAPLIQRINSRHGAHTVDYAAEIGLGTLAYELIDITDAGGIGDIEADGIRKYNVYDMSGAKLLTNADSLDSLTSGLYIINGIKTLIQN